MIAKALILAVGLYTFCNVSAVATSLLCYRCTYWTGWEEVNVHAILKSYKVYNAQSTNDAHCKSVGSANSSEIIPAESTVDNTCVVVMYHYYGNVLIIRYSASIQNIDRPNCQTTVINGVNAKSCVCHTDRCNDDRDLMQGRPKDKYSQMPPLPCYICSYWKGASHAIAEYQAAAKMTGVLAKNSSDCEERPGKEFAILSPPLSYCVTTVIKNKDFTMISRYPKYVDFSHLYGAGVYYTGAKQTCFESNYKELEVYLKHCICEEKYCNTGPIGQLPCVKAGTGRNPMQDLTIIEPCEDKSGAGGQVIDEDYQLGEWGETEDDSVSVVAQATKCYKCAFWSGSNASVTRFQTQTVLNGVLLTNSKGCEKDPGETEMVGVKTGSYCVTSIIKNSNFRMILRNSMVISDLSESGFDGGFHGKRHICKETYNENYRTIIKTCLCGKNVCNGDPTALLPCVSTSNVREMSREPCVRVRENHAWGLRPSLVSNVLVAMVTMLYIACGA